MFDDVAKFQMKRERISIVFGGLRKQLGSITKGIYTHYVYDGRQNNMDWFTLFYKLNLEDGAIDTGELKVIVFYNGERHGITRIHLGMG